MPAHVRTTPPTDPIILRMNEEGLGAGSQAARLSQVLLDSIGPRLVNSDLFNKAQDWVIGQYASWGISAKKEPYGTWNSWKRGVTHVDLVFPRVRTLEAQMLGWSPGTGGQTIEADVVLFPDVKTPEEFARVAPSLRGKIILMSPENPSCRTSDQWNQFGQPEAAAQISQLRSANQAAWSTRLANGGNQYSMPKEVGAAAVIFSAWSQYPGVNKIFGRWTQQVPTIDASCEDYGLLYRLAANNQSPKVRIHADAEFLGELPVSNVIATIPGSEKPNEYIVFSAHFDSWDGSSGATDNGTGTITMLEAARILKKVYPNPKRTIVIGHWGGEEQGLNGSRAWVEDHPEIIAGMRAGWNQDNGTGRVRSIGPGPFPTAQAAIEGYLSQMPSEITRWINVGGAGPAGSGGSDHSSFQCAGGPVHSLGALAWDYSNLTWHTNRDTYDKVVMADLQNNATLVAMLTYLADQNPDSSPLQKLQLPATCAKAVRATPPR